MKRQDVARAVDKQKSCINMLPPQLAMFIGIAKLAITWQNYFQINEYVPANIDNGILEQEYYNDGGIRLYDKANCYDCCDINSFFEYCICRCFARLSTSSKCFNGRSFR